MFVVGVGSVTKTLVAIPNLTKTKSYGYTFLTDDGDG